MYRWTWFCFIFHITLRPSQAVSVSAFDVSQTKVCLDKGLLRRMRLKMFHVGLWNFLRWTAIILSATLQDDLENLRVTCKAQSREVTNLVLRPFDIDSIFPVLHSQALKQSELLTHDDRCVQVLVNNIIRQ